MEADSELDSEIETNRDSFQNNLEGYQPKQTCTEGEEAFE